MERGGVLVGPKEMEVWPQIRLIVVAELDGNKEILGGSNGIRVRPTN